MLFLAALIILLTPLRARLPPPLLSLPSFTLYTPLSLPLHSSHSSISPSSLSLFTLHTLLPHCSSLTLLLALFAELSFSFVEKVLFKLFASDFPTDELEVVVADIGVAEEEEEEVGLELVGIEVPSRLAL